MEILTTLPQLSRPHPRQPDPAPSRPAQPARPARGRRGPPPPPHTRCEPSSRRPKRAPLAAMAAAWAAVRVAATDVVKLERRDPPPLSPPRRSQSRHRPPHRSQPLPTLALVPASRLPQAPCPPPWVAYNRLAPLPRPAPRRREPPCHSFCRGGRLRRSRRGALLHARISARLHPSTGLQLISSKDDGKMYMACRLLELFLVSGRFRVDHSPPGTALPSVGCRSSPPPRKPHKEQQPRRVHKECWRTSWR